MMAFKHKQSGMLAFMVYTIVMGTLPHSEGFLSQHTNNDYTFTIISNLQFRLPDRSLPYLLLLLAG